MAWAILRSVLAAFSLFMGVMVYYAGRPGWAILTLTRPADGGRANLIGIRGPSNADLAFALASGQKSPENENRAA